MRDWVEQSSSSIVGGVEGENSERDSSFGGHFGVKLPGITKDDPC